jgi:hypothetical protein
MLAENSTNQETLIANIATANRQAVAQWRVQNVDLSPLALCVAAESEAPTHAFVWRDVFCRECERNECLEGTAEQLAEKIRGLGWFVEDLNRFLVVCPEYQG